VIVGGCEVVCSDIGFAPGPSATAAGSSSVTIPCLRFWTSSWLILPYIATPIFVQLFSKPVPGPSVGSAALAALAAFAARLSNAVAPHSLSACAASCAAASAGCFPSAAASSLWRLLLVFFFTLGGGNGGCLVPDEEEGGGVERNCLSLSVVVGNRKGGRGVCVLGAISGCLVAEEEGSKSV
jgi:hypothetical protein